MAVSTPVLERELTREKPNTEFAARISADEEHNSRIKKNYAMLINPEAKLDEVLGRSETEAKSVSVQAVAPIVSAREIAIERKPYFVENARATAAIFRADSPVNKLAADRLMSVSQESEDEESEDLRPTPTTIQYKTSGVQNSIVKSQAENVSAEKRSALSRKEKIAIAVVAAVIVALIVMVIINSAIISGINSELSTLQSTLTTVKGTYGGINDQINSFAENLTETVENFAYNHGMVR